MTTDRLAAIKEQIATYEKKYGRDRGSVSLLAVSKKQPIEKIKQAYDAGQRIFAENYVQEALEKITALQDLAIEWHFIGHLQSNKSRTVAEHFDWVHSVDSEKIAQRLNDQRPANMAPINICIEVNISSDTHKSGVTPEQAIELAHFCQNLPHIKLRGLMTITAIESPEDTRKDFFAMHELWQTLNKQGLNLDTLSMGMTADFELAIAEGATMIRLGTAVFGPRS